MIGKVDTLEQLKEWISKEGEIHIHRVVATSRGYTRFFVITSTQDLKTCTTPDNCLRLEHG